MVVPTQNFIPIFIEEGLFLEARPDQMENFKHTAPMFLKQAWDPENHYVVPWLWGTTGIAVNTKLYTGGITSWSLVFDPPEELKGKINVVPVMNDVINAVMMWKGYPICDDNREHQGATFWSRQSLPGPRTTVPTTCSRRPSCGVERYARCAA
jgi:spermidine/putrescine transport system substrate-binding protein